MSILVITDEINKKLLRNPQNFIELQGLRTVVFNCRRIT